MLRRRVLPRSRSGLVTGLGGPAACVSVAASGGSVLPAVFETPALPVRWRVLRPRRAAPGTLPWWFRRFSHPHDLLALKGTLLVAIFLAGGLLSGS